MSPPDKSVVRDRREVVLLVEDEAAVREVAMLILDMLGYDVIEFGEATAARDLLAGDTQVSVLFTDIRMAGPMNGTDLALEARRLRPDLPILLTTGNTGDIAPHVLRRLPGVEVLTKPYGRARLQRILAAAIARRPAR
jgi:CheY-like chemotaxis protein